MSAMDLDAFNTNISAWLDDEEATSPVEDEVHTRAGDAAGAFDQALTAAQGHENCSVDPGRTFDVVIRVASADGIITVQRIPPGVALSCVLGELRHNLDISFEVVGWTHADEPVGSTEADGVKVTSENPDIVATWDGGPVDHVYTVDLRVAALALAALVAAGYAWRHLHRRP